MIGLGLFILGTLISVAVTCVEFLDLASLDCAAISLLVPIKLGVHGGLSCGLVTVFLLA